MRHLVASWFRTAAGSLGLDTGREKPPPEPGAPSRYLDIAGEPGWYRPSFRMLSCDARDQVSCSAAAYGWNGFEPPMPAYFARAVEQAGTAMVVDVGANTGFYGLLALAVSREVRVTAYEPLPSVRKILRANIMLNPDRRRIAVSPCALSDAKGRRTLFVPAAEHGLVETSASLAASFKENTGSRHQVGVATLDGRHAGKPRVAVLKVDAEGHDLEVLRGGTTMLLRDRPTVFVEVLHGADEDGLTQLLNQCGYCDSVLRQDGATEPCKVVTYHTDAWNHMWVPQEAA